MLTCLCLENKILFAIFAKLALNSQYCLVLPSAGIGGMHYHIWSWFWLVTLSQLKSYVDVCNKSLHTQARADSILCLLFLP